MTTILTGIIKLTAELSTPPTLVPLAQMLTQCFEVLRDLSCLPHTKQILIVIWCGERSRRINTQNFFYPLSLLVTFEFYAVVLHF